MYKITSDIIVDLQAGDTGKGKVAHALCENNNYTHVIRYNGGGNAGHTIYHNGIKFVTHFIPVGVIYNIKSIIGPGCVVNPETLEHEILELEKGGFDVRNNLFIDKRAHVITPNMVEEDAKDSKIGTTKTGNGPTYREKYNRTGIRAENYPELQKYLIDVYEEFSSDQECRILFEGAQGFELDIDWGDYPYVTSSHCTVGGALATGVPYQSIRDVYGVIKAYRTYVGNKSFETNSAIFEQIREVGNEYGATTGRKRQIDWLNLDDVIKACRINGVTKLIVNKVDVIEQVGHFNLIHNNVNEVFDNSDSFLTYIKDTILSECITVNDITFSMTPHGI